MFRKLPRPRKTGIQPNQSQEPVMRPLWDRAATADFLGVQPSTLDYWRTHGGGPKYTKIARLVRYRPEDVEAFIADGSRRTTSDVPASSGSAA